MRRASSPPHKRLNFTGSLPYKLLGAGIKLSDTPKWLTRKKSSKTGEVTKWCVRSLSTGPCTANSNLPYYGARAFSSSPLTLPQCIQDTLHVTDSSMLLAHQTSSSSPSYLLHEKVASRILYGTSPLPKQTAFPSPYYLAACQLQHR